MSKKSVGFGRFLRRYIDDEVKFRKWLNLGIAFESFRRRRLPSRKARFLRIINSLAVEEIYYSLTGRETAWVNLLAPSELLLPLGINPVSAEGVSGMLASMHLEGFAISSAAESGIPDSLCTFHRTSLGASIKKLFPAPRFIMTSTIFCDGNLPTFKRISREYQVPFILIDVPRGRMKNSVGYVHSQLKEAIELIEEITGKPYPMNLLSDILAIERQTVENLSRVRKEMKSSYLPQELYEYMNALYVMHTLAGDIRLKDASEEFERDLIADRHEQKKILWLHIPPYYDNELFKIFSPKSKHTVVGNELMWDWLYPVEPDRPLESLAEKLVFNPLCGGAEDRWKLCADLADDFGADGIVHFTHWGCRQSAGSVSYLKKMFESKGLPFLELTGDCVYHTSEGAGQLRTRAQAFLEILEGRR